MKVYLLYETTDSDEHGSSEIDLVKAVYSDKKTAQKAKRVFIQTAEEDGQDYRYSIVPREVI